MFAAFRPKLRAKFGLTTFTLFLLALHWLIPLAANAQTHGVRQHFVCNVGYSLEECRTAIAPLRKALSKYPADALGEWTWVLVRSEDWKRILLDRGFDPNLPAFTFLPKRETFLDGALVVSVSSRGVELSAQWHMPIAELLDLAIRHEIAHGVCNERNESRVELAAAALKEGKPLTCQTTLLAQAHRNEARKQP